MKIASKVLAAGLVFGTAALAVPAQAAPYWAEHAARHFCRSMDQGTGLYQASVKAAEALVYDGYWPQAERAMGNGTYTNDLMRAFFSRCPQHFF